MKSVTVKELKAMMDSGEDFQLIDVREPNEVEVASLGGVLIPLATVPLHTEKFEKEKKVIVHCRSGKRSANAVNYMEQQGYDNLYNLEGGILAWADEIDPSMSKY